MILVIDIVVIVFKWEVDKLCYFIPFIANRGIFKFSPKFWEAIIL